MSRYHLNGKGEPAVCNAVMKPCPLGGDHYDSQQAAAEAAIAAELGIVASDIPTAVIPEATDSWTYGQIRVRELPIGTKLDANRALAPAGRYFLGDPCYTAGKDDDSWQKWCEVADLSSNAFNEPICGASYNGYPMVASSTAYGDGSFWGSNGEEYSVDAGLIGVVPEAVIKGMGIQEAELGPYGSWVEVDQPTTLEYDGDTGTIYFGPVAIHTGDNDEDEDEDEETYCEICGDEKEDRWSSWCNDCADREFADA